MQRDVCPECGERYKNPEGQCLNPDCPSRKKQGFRVPTHGWGGAIIFALALCVIVAIVLVIVPSKYKEPKPDDEATGVAGKIGKITSGESEAEVILAQGSTEAKPEEEPVETPGGLSWDDLRYPGSERLLNYFGRELRDDEQAYLTHSSYDAVKDFYSNLITKEFYKDPQMMEIVNNGVTKLTLQNQTGSLSVWVTAYGLDENGAPASGQEGNVYILVTKLENIAGENLKPYGGPVEEQERKYGDK